MKITGAREYTSQLDGLKVETFLREQGMREQDMKTLTIHFVHRVPHFWPWERRARAFEKKYGRYQLFRRA